MNEFICNVLVELINVLDIDYRNSIERKRKYHIKDYKKGRFLLFWDK